MTELEKLIKRMLKNGPVRSTKVMDEAFEYNYSSSQVHRVADQLGVTKKIKGTGQRRRSYWSLT